APHPCRAGLVGRRSTVFEHERSRHPPVAVLADEEARAAQAARVHAPDEATRLVHARRGGEQVGGGDALHGLMLCETQQRGGQRSVLWGVFVTHSSLLSQGWWCLTDSGAGAATPAPHRPPTVPYF